MVTKKVRTEYMKKFREPKWETFSKCYEDSLKYRLTRRVMEHSHKPWFWEGWEGGSVRSSGKSTPRTAGPRPGRNRVAPPPAAETNRPRSGPDAGPPLEEREVTEAADADAAAPAENAAGGPPNASPPNASPPNASLASHEPDADDGPEADGDPAESAASPRRRRDGRPGNGSPTDRKPERAKSQSPPGGAGDEAAAPNDQDDRGERCHASVRTPPPSHPPAHRRRARSADPDELRRRQLTASAAADQRWVTEYMRCFSARVDARPRL